MKVELLHQIQLEQRRRRRRLIALGAAAALVSVICVAGFMTKLYLVEATPSLDPSNTASMTLTTGTGMAIGNRFFLISDTATLKFSYEGHLSQSQVVSKAEEANSLKILLLPEPKRLLLATNPVTEVVWMMNQEFISQDATVAVEVAPNRLHTIEALDYLGRSVAREVEIDWREREAQELIFELSSWAISVTSNPDGAKVFSDGQQLGVTPLDMVPGYGQDAILIRKDGFQSESISISRLLESGSSRISVSLKEQAARLPISLTPKGGQLSGGTLSGDGASLIPATPLPSEVTYFKQGYVAESRVITSETRRVSFDLKSATGEVLITSPVGASVSITGFGTTRLPARLELPVGEALLTVSAEGFKEQEIRVTIFQDEVVTLSPALETLESYRARTAAQREAGPHGIFLQRVVGEPIELGANRNEKGQRANEIQRRVEFTRHFYISETEISREQFSQYSGQPSNSKLPITGVSWDEAAKFCNYLSQIQGFTPFYVIRNGRVVGWTSDSIGYRLPTEAEWEYVASKYGKRVQRIFTWGDDYEIPDANFGNIADKAAEGKAKRYIADRSDGHAEAAPIGFSKQVGDISDLSGNVSEWVHDYYSISVPTQQPLVDYQGPTRGSQHFVKGSNYLSSSWTELRSSYREPIDGTRVDVGFRVARYVF